MSWQPWHARCMVLGLAVVNPSPTFEGLAILKAPSAVPAQESITGAIIAEHRSRASHPARGPVVGECDVWGYTNVTVVLHGFVQQCWRNFLWDTTVIMQPCLPWHFICLIRQGELYVES
jgi:hypothetical protein